MDVLPLFAELPPPVAGAKDARVHHVVAPARDARLRQTFESAAPTLQMPLAWAAPRLTSFEAKAPSLQPQLNEAKPTMPEAPDLEASGPEPLRPESPPQARTAPKPLCISPEALHPALWLGHQLARQSEDAVATGFAKLDAELPGHGWPRRALTELLLAQPGIGEMRLIAPSLAAAQEAGRLVMLFDPPAGLCAAALEQMGLQVEELLVINTRARVIPGTDSLWALEQALKSGHVGAVVAWLPPRLRAERLRRLQLAAHAHDGPAFVLCEMNAAQRPTAAPLRLALRADGADRLGVRVLKRRGPPLETALRVELPPVLSEVAQQRAWAGTGPGAGHGATRRRSAALHAAAFVNLAAE